MTNHTPRSLLSILQEHFDPREEGWAWLAPRGERVGGVVSQIEGAEVTLEQLSDMVVFNDRHAWSMREEDAAAA